MSLVTHTGFATWWNAQCSSRIRRYGRLGLVVSDAYAPGGRSLAVHVSLHQVACPKEQAKGSTSAQKKNKPVAKWRDLSTLVGRPSVVATNSVASAGREKEASIDIDALLDNKSAEANVGLDENIDGDPGADESEDSEKELQLHRLEDDTWLWRHLDDTGAAKADAAEDDVYLNTAPLRDMPSTEPIPGAISLHGSTPAKKIGKGATKARKPLKKMLDEEVY
ncbi:hypothetical protein FRB96_002475 [Tulasnella sp. 330]|nr:hypothetical protein FRB96_002475 [Tulasnella sp. 330]